MAADQGHGSGDKRSHVEKRDCQPADARGNGRSLAAPAGLTGGGAIAVRGDWAVGFANQPGVATPSTGPEAQGPGKLVVSSGVRWNLRAGEPTAFPDFGDLYAVNARGDALMREPLSREDRVLVDGQAVKLPDLSPGGRTTLVSINDAGTRIAGSFTSGREQEPHHQPVVWRC